jgi:hypothetical protein
VNQRLRRRIPQHAGDAMNHEQHHRVPHLELAREKERCPRDRNAREQHHADLNDAARIEAVRERAGPDREEQERQPMRDDGEAGEGRRMKFLEDHPVADHVLDAVGHHRGGLTQKERAIAGIAKRSEGLLGHASLRSWRVGVR